MTRDNSQITYSPYTKKFYEGAWDRDGTDFTKDYGMTAIAKLNVEKEQLELHRLPIYIP